MATDSRNWSELGACSGSNRDGEVALEDKCPVAPLNACGATGQLGGKEREIKVDVQN